ncbi:MAG TPA: YgjP-like metallopeptidase domain-containing protein [Pseudomonadales bacterium]|nr:YgjP-like metallopeptidase domain-containing protein [Pseudomonadales bacterium]
MSELAYLSHYAPHLLQQVKTLIDEQRLGDVILKKYPLAHQLRSDKALYEFTNDLKNQFMRNAKPLSKVQFDEKINPVKHALGMHTQISRVQGGKLVSKNEIRIASIFKRMPEDFLRMIVVHELAHIKEKEHNKDFYKLCQHMEPNYHQLEFEARLYLTHVELFGELYS